MKAIIGTSFIRNSTGELLQAGQTIEDFTDEELSQYEGLIKIEQLEKKENTENKKSKIKQ